MCVSVSEMTPKLPPVVFSHAEDERLIHAVSTYPVIYNASRNDHKTCEGKDNLWKEISAKVERTGNVSLNYIYLY